MIPGSTSKSILMNLVDLTTNGPLTGFQANRTSFKVVFCRPGGNDDIAAGVALGAFNSNYSSRGLFEIDATNMKGVCRVDVPNAALAIDVDEVLVQVVDAAGDAVGRKTISLSQVSLGAILDTALTETSGQLAAAFVKLFNVTTPTLVASDVMRGTNGAPTEVQMNARTLVAAAYGTASNQTTIAGLISSLENASIPNIVSAMQAVANDFKATDNPAGVWDLAGKIDGKTPKEAFQIIAAAIAGKLSGAGTGEETVKGLDGTTPRAVATTDALGNRTGMTYP